MQDPSRLNKRATDFLEEFREAQQHLAIRRQVDKEVHWRPPPRNGFKLNFDAAIFEELNVSNFGVVIHNGQRAVMAAIAARGPPILGSEEAEVLACRKALEFTVDEGFTELLVEG